MVQGDHDKITELEKWRDNSVIPIMNNLVDTVNGQTTLLTDHDKTIKEAITTANKFITWTEQHQTVTHQAEDKQINDLVAATVDHAAAIVAHEDRIKGVETTVQGVREYTQDKLSASISGLNAELTTMNSKIESVNMTNSKQDTDISNLSGGLKTSVDEIMKSVSEVSNSLATIKANHESMMDSLRELQTRIQNIEEIAGVKAEAKPPTGGQQPPKPPTTPPPDRPTM
jgi:chromosome segregation ATPase